MRPHHQVSIVVIGFVGAYVSDLGVDETLPDVGATLRRKPDTTQLLQLPL